MQYIFDEQSGLPFSEAYNKENYILTKEGSPGTGE